MGGVRWVVAEERCRPDLCIFYGDLKKVGFREDGDCCGHLW